MVRFSASKKKGDSCFPSNIKRAQTKGLPVSTIIRVNAIEKQTTRPCTDHSQCLPVLVSGYFLPFHFIGTMETIMAPLTAPRLATFQTSPTPFIKPRFSTQIRSACEPLALYTHIIRLNPTTEDLELVSRYVFWRMKNKMCGNFNDR